MDRKNYRSVVHKKNLRASNCLRLNDRKDGETQVDKSLVLKRQGDSGKKCSMKFKGAIYILQDRV